MGNADSCSQKHVGEVACAAELSDGDLGAALPSAGLANRHQQQTF